MDSPATAVELVEKFEDGKDGGPSFHCDLYDTEIVRKIAQMFLPGLATACVDNTTGDIFKTPASVAVDIRTEMVDYLTQRSESFIAESVILEGDAGPEASDHPYDILSDFVDDFASLKRNLFSRVSGWLLSEKREDKIDDVVQEMEMNGFWLMDRREAIAQSLLKNVDSKNEFHCNMKFNTAQELNEHLAHCGFRPMNCMNEGCTAIFCASQMGKHDSVCAFKIIPCEQKCSESLMRREMDKHCITVCPMKLVNCPFYAIGCQSSVPYCQIEKHCLDYLHSHLLHILQGIHKEVSVEDLKKRVQRLEEASSGKLGEARNARSLTISVKDLEAKLGPLQVSSPNKVVEKETESDQVKEGTEIPSENKTEHSQDREGTETPDSKEMKENGRAKEAIETKSGDEREHAQVKQGIETSSEEEKDDDQEKEITKHGQVKQGVETSSEEEKDDDQEKETKHVQVKQGIETSSKEEKDDEQENETTKHGQVKQGVETSSEEEKDDAQEKETTKHGQETEGPQAQS